MEYHTPKILDKIPMPSVTPPKDNSLEKDIETAKRNYIKMFNDLVADEELTVEKIKNINQMISIILAF